MGKDELILLSKAYAMSMVAKAQTQALAQFLIDDDKKDEYNKAVRKNIQDIIEQEQNESFKNILKESFESIG